MTFSRMPKLRDVRPRCDRCGKERRSTMPVAEVGGKRVTHLCRECRQTLVAERSLTGAQ